MTAPLPLSPAAARRPPRPPFAAAAVIFLAPFLLAAAPAPPEDFDAPLQEVRSLLRERRYSRAIDTLRLFARQVQELRLEDLRPAFPDPPPGWTAGPPIGAVADEDVWSRRLEGRRSYLRDSGGARIEVAIDLASPLAPTLAMGLNPLFVNADPRSRLLKVDGEPALLRLFPDTGEADLRVLVGRDVIVTVASHGLAREDVLLDLAKRVDFRLLRARAESAGGP